MFRDGCLSIVLGVLIILSGLLYIPSDVGGGMIIVDGLGGTIQEAIDNASEGDTIYVLSGVYFENLHIGKAITLMGEDAENTIIDGCGGDSTIDIEYPSVAVKNLTITNSTDGLLVYFERCVIQGNIVENNTGNGLYSRYFGNGSVENNTFRNNGGNGITLLSNSNYNTIANNEFSGNTYGAYFVDSYYNTLHHNYMDEPGYDYTYGGNDWDDGSEGNYWYDYDGYDNDSNGIGDTPYVIEREHGVSEDRYPLMSPPGNYIPLYPGWNLISIPVVPYNISCDDVLSSIRGDYDAVQVYKEMSWGHYQVDKPQYLNDVVEVNHTVGFWVHVNSSERILLWYEGEEANQSEKGIVLDIGWNLVGYPSIIPNQLAQAPFDTGIIGAIWRYDGCSGKWIELGVGDTIGPGVGYWIYATEEIVWG